MPRLTPTLATIAMTATLLVAPAAAHADEGCTLPDADGTFATAPAESVRLDPVKLQRAIDYASQHLRLSVQVFRDDCLVGSAASNVLTQDVPWNVWSSTKSVVSLLAGLAIDRGLLGLDDPIGDHVPAKYGDAAHRAITVRQLLTETSGLD